MSSIIDEGMAMLSGVEAEFLNFAEPLERTIEPLRKSMLESGHIILIEDASAFASEVSLATVDGAMVVDQLAHVDMLVTGASIGEGVSSKLLYETDMDYPATSHIGLIQHESKNKDVARAVMGAQELCLIDHINHNVRIMDGSWLSGVTALVLTMMESSTGSRALLDYLLYQRTREGWDGMELVRAVDRIIAPWRYVDADNDIIALSKSDSSQFLSRNIGTHLSEEVAVDFRKLHMMDRTLASMVLKPGEMFKPSYVDAGRSLYPRMSTNKVQRSKIAHEAKELFSSLSGSEQQLYKTNDYNSLTKEDRSERLEYLQKIVEQLTGSGYEDSRGIIGSDSLSVSEKLEGLDSSNGAWIWSTYFKPSNFDIHHRALRMEFSRGEHALDLEGAIGSPEDYIDSVTTRAQRLVGLVDADIISSEISEPWSQYVADRKAKEVSSLASLARTELIGNMQNERLIAGLLRGYRT